MRIKGNLSPRAGLGIVNGAYLVVAAPVQAAGYARILVFRELIAFLLGQGDKGFGRLAREGFLLQLRAQVLDLHPVLSFSVN